MLKNTAVEVIGELVCNKGSNYELEAWQMLKTLVNTQEVDNAAKNTLADWALKFLPDCVQRDDFRNMFLNKN